jgi:hypothetical protein
MVRPPSARIGPVTPEERKAVIAKSPLKGKYDQEIDEESAFEMLQKRTQSTAATPAPGQAGAPGAPAAPGQAAPDGGGVLSQIGGVLGSLFGTNNPRSNRLTTGQLITRQITRSVTNRVAGQIVGNLGKSIAGSMGNTVGRAIVRGALGGILRR